jgi:hypothetical protein
MRLALTHFSRSFVAVAALGALVTMAAPAASARDEDGFGYLAGTWTGEGTVKANGKSERIRCRVTYAVSGDKAGLNQTLVCASASYKFDVFSNVMDKGGQLSGQWQEKTRNIVGNVSGTARGNVINTTVNGGGFSAALSVSTNGNRQNVVIRPANYEVTEVAMALTRAR